MGGKSGGSQTVTQSAKPWSAQIPYLRTLFSEAEKLRQSGGPAYYPGATLAPQNDNQTAAQDYLTNYATGQGQGISDAISNNLRFNLDNVLNPDSNPYIQQAAQSLAQPIYQQLNDSTLPTIQNAAANSNNLGSSREALLETGARQSADQAVANATAGLYSTAYGQGLDANSKAVALLPSTIQSILSPGTIQGTVGDAQQAYQQAVIQDALNRYNYEANLPYANLSAFQNFVSGNYGSQGSSTTSGGNTASTIGSALGGGLSGYALGGALGMGTAGSLGLGGLGALAAFL